MNEDCPWRTWRDGTWRNIGSCCCFFLFYSSSSSCSSSSGEDKTFRTLLLDTFVLVFSVRLTWLRLDGIEGCGVAAETQILSMILLMTPSLFFTSSDSFVVGLPFDDIWIVKLLQLHLQVFTSLLSSLGSDSYYNSYIYFLTPLQLFFKLLLSHIHMCMNKVWFIFAEASDRMECR